MMIQYFFDIVSFDESMEYWKIVFSIQRLVLLRFLLADDQNFVPWLDCVNKIVKHDDFPLSGDAAGFDSIRWFLDIDFLKVAVLTHIFHDSELTLVTVGAFA